LIKADLGQIDLVIYSLASPVRLHPTTGVLHRSVLKPIGQSFTNNTVDFHSGKVSSVTIEPCSGDDIENTVIVMGGEDWAMWMNALKENNLLAEGATTVAYSYIGSALTEAVYRNGTIGRAKDDLENTAFSITESLKDLKGKAYVSVNKALVTQASSAIPVIPLYIAFLYKIQKAEGTHEGCIEQIERLYAKRLYANGDVPVDEKGRIRIDDWELNDNVQVQIAELWAKADTENLPQLGDLLGYKKDFYNLFGFDVVGVDYEKDSDEMVNVPSIG